LHPVCRASSINELGAPERSRATRRQQKRRCAPINRSIAECHNGDGRKSAKGAVFFICTKGGRGGAGPDPHTCRSRKSSIEDPPQFFGQIFCEKILETKILASHYLPRDPRRSTSCHGPQPRSEYISARRSARHASLACQPSISCSWRRSSLYPSADVVAGSGEHGVDAIAIAPRASARSRESACGLRGDHRPASIAVAGLLARLRIS